MKTRTLIAICASLLVTAGCGGGGGGAAAPGGGDTTPPDIATVTLSASKPMALADGADAVAITVDVKQADGTPVPDGTTVTFSVPENNGTLSTASATTTNGAATVTLTHPPVTEAKNKIVTVTGTAGSVSSGKDVKFINQPASAEVMISTTQEVANLAALNFKLTNSSGASFDNAGQPVSAINNALGSLVVGNFDAAANNNNIGLINSGTNGFNTGKNPIIKVTCSVNSGMPAFDIDKAVENFKATDKDGNQTSPPITSNDIVVSVVFDTEL